MGRPRRGWRPSWMRLAPTFFTQRRARAGSAWQPPRSRGDCSSVLIVSLYVPQNAETRGMLNGSRIARMKPGSILINTARWPCRSDRAFRGAPLGSSRRSGTRHFWHSAFLTALCLNDLRHGHHRPELSPFWVGLPAGVPSVAVDTARAAYAIALPRSRQGNLRSAGSVTVRALGAARSSSICRSHILCAAVHSTFIGVYWVTCPRDELGGS